MRPVATQGGTIEASAHLYADSLHALLRSSNDCDTITRAKINKVSARHVVRQALEHDGNAAVAGGEIWQGWQAGG